MASREAHEQLVAEVERELSWMTRHIPLTRTVAAEVASHDFSGLTLCLNVHLDVKVIPVLEALLSARARLLVLSCNPQTTRDAVVAYLKRLGAEVYAWRGMSDAERIKAMDKVLDVGFDYVSEMGADLTVHLLQNKPEAASRVKAGMEATGTGILRLRELPLPFPVFNWDDVPLKEGFHNRYLVGLTVWNTFLNVTHLSLFGRRVLVVGYGPVGQGIASYARVLGARVFVCDLDPARRLEAVHGGFDVVDLEGGLPQADVVVTATGREGVIGERHFDLLPEGCILLNAGHSNREIDVDALLRHPAEEVRPFIDAIRLRSRTVYLLARGAMLNLAAGPGDYYDAFDLTSALMLAGILFLVERGMTFPPGIHLLPAEVEQKVASLATRQFRL